MVAYTAHCLQDLWFSHLELGIRVGIYLQWVASFLANNLLPKSHKEIQKVYLLFSLAVCLATIILSSTMACKFSIEIERFYWMYWRGFLCVFASSPSLTRLGSRSKWIELNWITVIQYTTHMLMTCHGIWFMLYAYDLVFPRMPCGTYQFFFASVLDPSESFWWLKNSMTQLLSPLALPLLLAFPFTGFLLASEVKQSVQDSSTYQMFYPRSSVAENGQSEIGPLNPSILYTLALRISLRLKRLLRRLRRRYRKARKMFGLSKRARSRVRLITPIDIRDRRYPVLTKHKH